MTTLKNNPRAATSQRMTFFIIWLYIYIYIYINIYKCKAKTQQKHKANMKYPKINWNYELKLYKKKNYETMKWNLKPIVIKQIWKLKVRTNNNQT